MSNLYRVAVEDVTSIENDETNCIPFSAGNPRVEHIVGSLHLYRPRSVSTEGAPHEHTVRFRRFFVLRCSFRWRGVAGSSSGWSLFPTNAEIVCEQDGIATTQVCVLAVPGDLGFKEFCEFLGSYMPAICNMWMVRREDTTSKTVCMALVQFNVVNDAVAFVDDYNGRPFTPIEPDVICRCVAISRMEMIREPGTSSNTQLLPAFAQLPPVGHVELPTCPVCLERLDEHISGIITTVSDSQYSCARADAKSYMKYPNLAHQAHLCL